MLSTTTLSTMTVVHSSQIGSGQGRILLDIGYMNDNTRCPRYQGVAPNPGEIIAALPYLVGFPPVDAMVAVLLDSEGCLQMTARHDWDAIVEAPSKLAANLIDYARHCGCSSIALVAMGPTGEPGEQESILTHFANLVDRHGRVHCRNDAGRTKRKGVSKRARRRQAGIGQERQSGLAQDGSKVQVLWAVHSEADRWWAADCRQTCGPRSHQVPSNSDSRLVQRLGSEGREPAKTRQQIVSEFEPASGVVVGAVGRAVHQLAATISDADDVVLLKTSIVDRVELLLLADSAMGTEDLAMLAVACQDIRMRDSVLWRFTEYSLSDPKIWRNIWPRIQAALAGAPESHVAAVAAVAGLVAWQTGDGIRSQAALNRALKQDPAHGLAGLVHQAVSGGLPPNAWGSAMSGLTEMDCMYGIEGSSERGRSEEQGHPDEGEGDTEAA